LSLLDCQVAALANLGSAYLAAGASPARLGNAHASIVPYQVFDAADGPFVLAVGNDAQWRRCCEVLDHPAWADDPRFSTNPQRVRHRDQLVSALREVLRLRGRAHWMNGFRAAHVPAGPVQRVEEVFHDPQVRARGMVQAVVHPTAGPIELVANPWLRGETRGEPPRLGEGGEKMAHDWLADT
jgi:crotonobetainyl-CoA:carnitine CoA-transferase CaiB-like acyl-CoA transferase